MADEFKMDTLVHSRGPVKHDGMCCEVKLPFMSVKRELDSLVRSSNRSPVRTIGSVPPDFMARFEPNTTILFVVSALAIETDSRVTTGAGYANEIVPAPRSTVTTKAPMPLPGGAVHCNTVMATVSRTVTLLHGDE